MSNKDDNKKILSKLVGKLETPPNSENDETRDANEKTSERMFSPFSSSLEESISEIEDLTDTASEDAPERLRSPRVRLALGILVLVFAVTGVVSTVKLASNFIISVVERQSLKDEFSLFLYPMVIADPPSFTSPSELQSSTIIYASVWRIILFGDTSNYTKDLGMMTVPAPDVEKAAHDLFGAETPTLVHQTIDNIEFAFEYKPEKNSYIVPENPRFVNYTPLVNSVTNTGQTYKVSVEYIAPSPRSTVSGNKKDTPIKTVLYTVVRTRESMAVVSAENITDVKNGN
jgi:hypothetical protein